MELYITTYTFDSNENLPFNVKIDCNSKKMYKKTQRQFYKRMCDKRKKGRFYQHGKKSYSTVNTEFVVNKRRKLYHTDDNVDIQSNSNIVSKNDTIIFNKKTLIFILLAILLLKIFTNFSGFYSNYFCLPYYAPKLLK
jgi:hypothetical protein